MPRRLILHAPLALIALLFGTSVSVLSPEGGLSEAPFGIAERAADREAARMPQAATGVLPTQIALAE
jgi:hypothetical protein